MAKAFYIPEPTQVQEMQTREQIVKFMMLLLLIQRAEQTYRNSGFVVDIYFQNVSIFEK